MRKFKHVISLILVFALLLPLLSQTGFAQNNQYEMLEPVSVSRINPLYEGLISEDALKHDRGERAVPAEEIPYYTTFQEAGDVIQEGMKARQDVITVGYQMTDYSDDIAQALFDSIFDAALVHTGVPTEGDYLAWQFGGWRGNLSGYSMDGIFYLTFTYTLTYYTTAAQEQQMNTAVGNVLAGMNLSGKSDYEKVCAIYDYICANVTYDYANLDDDTHLLKYTAYAALVNKTAVCQGYALLFYRLALELGIDARFIGGVGGGGRHGWNIVELDNLYYNLDSTWDAGSNGYYYYFLKCNDNFYDHARDSRYQTESFNKAYPMGTTDYTPAPSVPEGDENGDWIYSAENGKATITGYNGSDANVVVPSELDGNPVVALSNTVFSGNTAIKTVSLPASMERIMDGWIDLNNYPYMSYGAFADCTNLTKVEIPENSKLEYIGEWAFYGCDSLSNVELPGSVRTLAMSCFEDCTSLTSMILPEGLEMICQNTFSGSGIKQLHLPSTCTEFNWANTMPALESVTVAERNHTYRSHEGVLYRLGPPAGSGEGWTLALYPINKPGETYRIPEFCETIFGDNFATSYFVTYLKKLYIGDAVAATGLMGGDSMARIPCEIIPDATNQHYRNEGKLLLSKDGKALIQVPHSITGELFVPATVEKLESYLFFDNTNLKTLRFTGNAPEMDLSSFGRGDYTAYYPANNATYTSEYLNNYRQHQYGSITWISYTCEKHQYETSIVAPTCEEKGYTTHTCYACGDTYTDSETAALGHDYVKGICSHCGEEDEDYIELEGLNCVDGIWGYYTNGKLDTSYTNMVFYEGIYYYVENGLINWDYVGLAQHKETEIWYYVQGGGVDRSFTGLTMYNGRWFYLEAGSITWSYTGLVEFEGNWYYVQYSQLNFDYTGLVFHYDNWYYVQNSMLIWDQYTLVNHGGTWYYVQNSTLAWGYYGLVNYNGVWYYLENSQITWNFTDLVLYYDVWYYVKGSTIAWDYTGVVPYNGGMYYVENGTINWGYYGSFTQDGVTYTIENGTVVA